MALSKPPSFIKILHNHDAPYLELPHDFVNKHMAGNIPEDVLIRSANGGFSWNAKMKKIGESVCFQEGWSKVVTDAQFAYEDMLFLWLVGESTFKMWIYSPITGCEKIMQPQTKHVNPQDDVLADDFVGIGGDGYPFFVRLLTKFVELAGIKNRRSLTLKSFDGNEKEVRLRVYYERLFKRVGMYVPKWWMDFPRSNNISEGDRCVLKYMTGDEKLCLAKVTKSLKM